MIKAVRIEFCKLKRRRIWVVPFFSTLLCLFLLFYGLRNMKADELQNGYLFSIYQMSFLNSLMMPLAIAVIASRLGEMEHQGQTLKQLKTMQPAWQILLTKVICGAFYLLFILLVQMIAICAGEMLFHFPVAVPWDNLAQSLLTNFGISVMILIFQLIISLRFSNQMVAFSLGLIGSFIGLFTLFFPPVLYKFIPWSYYGYLCNVKMDWSSVTRITQYRWVALPQDGLFSLSIFFLVFLIVGNVWFSRMEV